MPLDQRIQALLEARGDEIDPTEMTVPQLRQRARESVARWHAAGVRDHDVASVRDVVVELDGSRRRLRIYNPRSSGQGDQPGFPIVVYFHGGGWVLGDLETHDGICRAICQVGGAIVVAVEYGLAPEHPYPEPLVECEQAVLWASANAVDIGGNPSAIFVGGDSAGGNLAAVCALRLRDRGEGQVAGQILIYPVVDDPASGHGSMEEFKIGHTYGQNHQLLCRMMSLYTAGRIPLSHPDFAPIQTTSLVGAPTALILTAEYDMLRDEAEAYAGRLRNEGVDVSVERVAGVNHGFMHLTSYLPATDAAFERIGKWIRDQVADRLRATVEISKGEATSARL